MVTELKYKCQVVSFGRHIDNTCAYNVLDHNNCMIPLARVDKVKDLGVWFDEQLSFKEHMHDKINKAYSMLGIIKRNFKYLTIPTFILLYKNMVRSYLDYCSSVWSPYSKCDIEDLEKVQKRATRLLPELKGRNYIDRLKSMQIAYTTLQTYTGRYYRNI